MSALFKRAKRILSLVLVLGLLVTSIAPGMVPQVWAASTSITAGEIVAKNYDLTAAEKALLKSGYLVGNTIEYTEPADCVTVDMNAKTITAFEKDGWVPTVAKIMVGGETVETLNMVPGEAVTYEHAGQVFEVVVTYELTTTEISEETQELLLNAAGTLQEGLDNLKEAYKADTNLGTVALAMDILVELANGITMDFGGFQVSGKFETNAAITAVNALKAQSDSNNGKLNLQIVNEEYNAADSKVQYLDENGQQYFETLKNTYENLAALKEDGLLNNSILDAYLQNSDPAGHTQWMAFKNILGNLVGALKPYADRDAWVILDENPLAANVDYEELDDLVNGITGLTDVSGLELKDVLDVAEAEVLVSQNMKKVTVNVTLKVVGKNNQYKEYTYTKEFNAKEGIEIDEVVAEIETRGIEEAAISDWGSKYVAGQYVAKVENEDELPETLDADLEYNIVYSPKEYDVTLKYNNNAVMSYPYGYMYELEAHSNSEKAYDYKVNGVYQPQGTVLKIEDDLEIDRTVGRAYETTDLLTVIAQNFGNDKETAILTSKALKGNVKLPIRHPNSEDASTLLSIEGTTLTAETYPSNYEGLEWIPYEYSYVNGGAEGAKHYFDGATSVELTETYDSIFVTYILRLTNFDAEDDVKPWIELTGTLSEEAADQKAALDRLGSYSGQMGQLDKTKLGALNGVIDVTDLHSDPAKNAQLKADFKEAVGNIIDNNLGTNNLLKIKNILDEYNEGGLKYYYKNSAKVLDEINSLSSQLTALLADEEKEAALGVLVGAAGYPEYAEKIKDLESAMTTVKADLKAPNAAIDIEAGSIDALVDALAMAGTAGNSAADTPYLYEEGPFVIEAEGISTVKFNVVIDGSAPYTVYPLQGAEDYVVTQGDIDYVNGLIESYVGGKIEVEFYNSDYSETSLDALVGKALNEIGTQTFTWTPKTYTVVIDGEMNQTISVNDRSVDLFAHAESGYYYNYFIDGISKKVEEDTDYTFTVDQIRRLFTNGSYEIVREEVNVGEKTFTDWLDNLNDTIGREAFTVTGTTLTGEIGMSDMMNMVMGMMGGYSYIGLNDEGLLYMNADNATEVSLQTLVNAMLSDENFTEQTLIDLADNNGGTLVTTTIQLGDDEDNLAKDLTFVIKLTSVPPQMDNVAGLLKTLKGYMGFQAVDGTLAVTAEMPEKFYDVYLTALTLTGKVDLTDLNAVETEIAYTFLADYVKILTGEGVDATTYVNTLKKLGKEDLLAGYETYIDELLGMLGDSFTYDEEAENYALSLTASKELLEKILAIFGGDNLGSVTGLIKEMKDGGALIIPLTAEVTNFNDNNAAEDKYEAFIVNQGALSQGGLDKLEVVNVSTDLAADLAKSSGFNVVILQKNLGDDEHPVNLVIDADTNAYLDLNGKIITGNVTVNGQLTLIDSTFDTANAGGINGELFGNNISVIAGKYTTDVAKWLKSGYVQAEGAADELKAVSNELYTMTKQAPMAMRRAAQTPNEIVTVTLNTDLLQNRQDLNKSMAKAVAVDLASDLLMNFYTAASLSFGTEMEIYDIDDAELTTLLQWYADGITEIDAVNKALDCLNEEGLMNFINQVIEDMTDFETIAKGEVIASYDISSKCWTIVVEKQPDNSFDGGIAANPDLTKALTLNIEIAGEKEEVITDLAAELDKIVTSAIAIDEIEEMEYDGTNVTIGGTGHADVVVDMSGNHDYAAIIGIALAYSNVANKAEFVTALDDYFENGLTEKLEAAFDKATVADVIKALKALNMDTDLAEMIEAIGLADVADNSDAKTAELEAVYHPFLVAAGYILDYLDITGPSTKMSVLKNDDKYIADKENIGRAGTFTVAKGKGVEYDLEMTKIALTVKLFSDADTATIEVQGIDNLKYNGKDQKLVEVVDCDNGTPMFRVNGGEWTTEIPTGKEAGEYVVEYYADGDKGFKDSEIQTVTVEIAEKSSSNNKPSKPSLNKKDHVEIFSGYPDGTFRPKKAMTRAEVAVVFSKLMKPAMVEGKTYTTNFSDVETGKWYSNAIGFMVEQGILSGYTDGTFRPNQEITRAEFATIATKFEELTVGGDHKFSDVPETSWAYTFINFAAERGYVSGYSDGTFRPGKSITREEVATVLCKVLEREADKEYIKAHADEVTHFSDVEEKDWSYWFILEATNGHEYTKADNVETWTEIK